MMLRRIGVLSLAKIMGCVYGGLGLIFGAILAVLSLFGAAIGSAASGSGEAWFGAIFGVGAIIFLPLLYGFFGFLGGLISGSIYNLAARLVGGVELDLS